MRQSTRGVSVALLVIGALLLGGAGGCASETVPASSVRSQAPRDAFDGGREMAPTPDTMFALSRILIAQGKDRDALSVLSRIIQQEPDYMPAYNLLAELYVRSERTADALVVLQGALKRRPNDAIIHNNLGMVHLLRNEYVPALEHFTAAVNADVRNPQYRANQAAAYGLLGRDEEALMAYRGVLRPAQAKENLRVLTEARRTTARPAAEPGATAMPPTVAPDDGTANAE